MLSLLQTKTFGRAKRPDLFGGLLSKPAGAWNPSKLPGFLYEPGLDAAHCFMRNAGGNITAAMTNGDGTVNIETDTTHGVLGGGYLVVAGITNMADGWYFVAGVPDANNITVTSNAHPSVGGGLWRDAMQAQSNTDPVGLVLCKYEPLAFAGHALPANLTSLTYRYAYQNTDANRPTLAGVETGKPYLNFVRGSSQYLNMGDLSALFGSNAGTFAMRLKHNSTGDGVSEGQSTDNDSYYDAGNTSYPGILRSTRLNGQPNLPHDADATELIRNNGGGTWRRRVNGVEDINTSPDWNAGTNWLIGRQNPSEVYWNGRIYSWVITASDISDANAAKLETYLASLS